MSTFATQITNEKLDFHSNVTVQVAANSIHASVYGPIIERICQTVKDLGLDGDLLNFISTVRDVIIGSSIGANVTITPTGITVSDALSSAQFHIDNTGIATFGVAGGSIITIDPVAAQIKYSYTDSGTSTLMNFVENLPAFVVGATTTPTQTRLNATGKIPVMVSDAFLNGQTVVVSPINSFTSPANIAVFSVSAFVNILTYSGSGTLNTNINFTDIHGTGQVINITGGAAVGCFSSVKTFRAKAGTVMVTDTTFSGGTPTISYDISIQITQLD